ncbi:MAG: heavy-metal-associated domain-containing protein [Bacilli bacterium]|nr:heavy-metal-associated domain-containing protein [Bacilli bacterium]
MKNIELNIEGMKCEGCVNRIKSALSTIKGMDSFDLSLEDKKLTLSVKKEKTIDEIRKKIEALGFEVFE